MCFINENIICNQLHDESLPSDIERLMIELNFRSQKWLLVGAYRPPDHNPENFMNSITNTVLKIKYENVIILGDFNLNADSKHLDQFKNNLNLHNLITVPTCYKSVENPTCIDHIWVKQKSRFMNTETIETGLSDFHKMTCTTLNINIPKRSPKVISYRCYKNFDKHQFSKELKSSLQRIMRVLITLTLNKNFNK